MTIAVVRNSWSASQSGETTTAGAVAMTGQTGQLIAVLDNCLVTRLGWTKTAIAANVAAYKAPVGNGYYLYVDDSGTTTARIKGMEIAGGTTVQSQFGAFPNETQFNGGMYLWKSSTADASNRAYFFWGDTKTFHLFVYSTTFNNFYSFGDFISLRYPNAEAGSTYIIGGNLAAPLAGQGKHRDDLAIGRRKGQRGL